MGDRIEKFLEKHYTTNRRWKYCDKRLADRPIHEIVARREEAKIEDYAQNKDQSDERFMLKAREAEKKLKRLKMAKYSVELFDEIIQEMMKDKKTIMEMMAELDVDENTVFAAQTRLATKAQKKAIEDQMKKAAK